MAKQRPDEERKLYVSLNDDELRLKGDKLSVRVKRLEDIDRRKKAFASAIKVEQEAASEDATQLAEEIEHRREIRPVTCRWERGTEHWVCHRVDTGEVVDTAPITMADRQEELRLS